VWRSDIDQDDHAEPHANQWLSMVVTGEGGCCCRERTVSRRRQASIDESQASIDESIVGVD